MSEKIKDRNDLNFFFLQILLSVSVGPILLHFTLDCWVYPMKDYIGETGCHMMLLLRSSGCFIFQLQSFFISVFRYICVFHNDSLLNLNLSPNVSILVILILVSVSSLKSTKSESFDNINYKFNYNIKSSSNNLSNEIIKTGAFSLRRLRIFFF